MCNSFSEIMFYHPENKGGDRLHWDLTNQVRGCVGLLTVVNKWINQPDENYGMGVGHIVVGDNNFRTFYQEVVLILLRG